MSLQLTRSCRSKPESVIAPFLTELQARVKKEGIRVGSCERISVWPLLKSDHLSDPYLYSGVHVSLIGHDVERVKELGLEVRHRVKSVLNYLTGLDGSGYQGGGWEGGVGGQAGERGSGREDLSFLYE